MLEKWLPEKAGGDQKLPKETSGSLTEEMDLCLCEQETDPMNLQIWLQFSDSMYNTPMDIFLLLWIW